MISILVGFLSHGGVKLLIIGFYFVARILKANAEKNRKQNATLRGNTGISDFSSPENATSAAQSLPSASSAAAPTPMTLPSALAPFVSPPSTTSNTPDKAPAAPFSDLSIFRSKPDAKTQNKPSKSAPKSSDSPQNSPWSSNQNPFN